MKWGGGGGYSKEEGLDFITMYILKSLTAQCFARIAFCHKKGQVKRNCVKHAESKALKTFISKPHFSIV